MPFMDNQKTKEFTNLCFPLLLQNQIFMHWNFSNHLMIIWKLNKKPCLISGKEQLAKNVLPLEVMNKMAIYILNLEYNIIHIFNGTVKQISSQSLILDDMN